ncbi:MAG: hypothetical protein P0Y60_04840 [Candidatus Microbacterium colombiense]|nr:MAG: hypothetical protein P0Y60_04840 [Microbacterium sp.]
MNDLWMNGLQAVAVSVVTVAVLALLRLVTPAVRWERRLKAETEIYSALPDGQERELWGRRADAQAERLRIYRERFRNEGAILAWFAFPLFAVAVLILVVEGVSGWAFSRELLEASPWVFAATAAPVFLFAAVALFLMLLLVRDRSGALRITKLSGYPKMEALIAEERHRDGDTEGVRVEGDDGV